MRAGHHSDLLELELSRRQIPFVKYGGIRYLEAAHVKDFLCLLRLANNPADQLAWFRILQLLDGVGPVTARRVLDALDPATLTRLAELPARWHTAATAPASLRPSAAAAADRGARRRRRRRAAPGTLVERLRDALAPLIRAHYPDGRARLPDLDQLVAGRRARAATSAASSPSSRSTRPPRAPTTPARRTSTTTTWSSAPSTPPKASNGRPST